MPDSLTITALTRSPADTKVELNGEELHSVHEISFCCTGKSDEKYRMRPNIVTIELSRPFAAELDDPIIKWLIRHPIKNECVRIKQIIFEDGSTFPPSDLSP